MNVMRPEIRIGKEAGKDEQVWVVGHYDPNGKFIAATTCKNVEDAMGAVNYLNGGIKYRP